MGKRIGSCERLLLIIGTTGACMVCVGAFCGPYRISQSNPLLNWPARQYYIKKLTDKAMQPTVSWKSLKEDTCAKYEAAQMKYGNPAGQVMAQLLEEVVHAPVCGTKALCRKHMAERCIAYGYLIDYGLTLSLINALSLACMGVAAGILVSSSKRHWKSYAGCVVLFAGVIVLVALIWWANQTEAFLRQMQKSSVWPYAPLHGWGFHLNWVGAMFLQISGLCGLISGLKKEPRKDEAYDAEEALIVGPAGGQPLDKISA